MRSPSPSPSTLFTLFITAMALLLCPALALSESFTKPSFKRTLASSESGSGSLKASKCIQPPKCLNCISPAVQQKMAQCTANQAVRLLEEKTREREQEGGVPFLFLFSFSFLLSFHKLNKIYFMRPSFFLFFTSPLPPIIPLVHLGLFTSP